VVVEATVFAEGHDELHVVVAHQVPDAKGWELVAATARLCIMNMYLHGIDADPCPIKSGVDSLANDPGAGVNHSGATYISRNSENGLVTAVTTIP
jgi:hypothetical protein